MNIKGQLPFILIALGVIIAIHQYIFYDIWFQIEDLHHETWMIMFVFAGVVLIANRRNK